MHFEVLVQHSSNTSIGIKSAAACFLWERLWDCSIDALTFWTFSGVQTLRCRPGGFRLNVDLVALMFDTHSRIFFRSGPGARRPSLKCLRNALCFAIRDSLFLKTFRQRNLGARPKNTWRYLKMQDYRKPMSPLPLLYHFKVQAVTTPNVRVIFAAPSMNCPIFHGSTVSCGLDLPLPWGFEITHNYVIFGRNPLTSDQLDPKTSTWQHAIHIADKYSWFRRDSNPQIQQACGRRPTP
jgi:hypothetical protein